MHTEFLLDLKNKEYKVLTTAYECDALIITLFLSSEKILPDGNVVKQPFYARTNEIDVLDPNFHIIVINTLEERVANKHVERSNWQLVGYLF